MLERWRERVCEARGSEYFRVGHEVIERRDLRYFLLMRKKRLGVSAVSV